MIEGKITITFTKEELTPKVLIEGELDMLKMAALPYTISVAYQNHLNIVGDELRRKVLAKGLEADKPVVEKVELTEANNEKKEG